jgi:hypothetical protein|tara:strand:- start:155 stop:400 length:246 start_codon:yes stop_codon:yes gene_type:complete
MESKIKSVSDFKVMHSNAGYYIGRSCEEEYSEGEVYSNIPYDRASGYYFTQEAAEIDLKHFEKCMRAEFLAHVLGSVSNEH